MHTITPTSHSPAQCKSQRKRTEADKGGMSWSADTAACGSKRISFNHVHPDWRLRDNTTTATCNTLMVPLMLMIGVLCAACHNCICTAVWSRCFQLCVVRKVVLLGTYSVMGDVSC